MLAIIFSILIAFIPANSADSLSVSDEGIAVQKTNSPVSIDAIFIIGNKRTKPSIILRELSVSKGQVYLESDLEEILALDRSKLLNTRLFNSVDISILHLSETEVDIVINLSERWYTFPSPIFDLVDRNFNDWWQNQNKDISRTNIGVKIYQNNFRGRNESLRFLLQLGYTQQFGITYRIPYLDAKQRHGITLNFDYAENKNIAIRTVNHKPVFFDSEETLKISREYAVGYNYRKSFYSYHGFQASFSHKSVNDTIIVLNQEYFDKPSTDQKYISLLYSFVKDKRDNPSYPLKGLRLETQLRKQGIGWFNDVDRWDLRASLASFFDLDKSFYFANYTAVYISTPEEQPYSNLGALGYKRNFIRGYELYLIEGKSYYLNRSTLKYKLFSAVGRIGIIPIEQFKKVPLDIYLKTYFDMGYAENIEGYDLNKRLSDRFLFGAGGGLDFVTYYDTVIRVEYTINREKESGFFLHFRKEF